MLLAYVTLLDAAIARLPGLPNWRWHDRGLTDYALVLLFIAAGMTYDFLSRRQVHKAYLWGGTLFAVYFSALKLLF